MAINFLFIRISLIVLLYLRDNRLKKLEKLQICQIIYFYAVFQAILWTHLYKLSDFEALYLKRPEGCPGVPNINLKRSVCLLLVLESFFTNFYRFLNCWHLNRSYSSQFWKSQKTENILSTITFIWTKLYKCTSAQNFAQALQIS